MEIRILDLKDLNSWQQIRLEALKLSPGLFKASHEEEIDYTEEAWLACLKDAQIFGAFDKDQLVSTIGFQVLSLKKTQHRGILFGVYTTPAYRGQGVASQVLEAVIVYAIPLVLQIHLACATTNASALHLYQKYGFKIYGTEPGTLKIGDDFIDAHFMILKLKEYCLQFSPKI